LLAVIFAWIIAAKSLSRRYADLTAQKEREALAEAAAEVSAEPATVKVAATTRS
jgi:hypothetical protein